MPSSSVSLRPPREKNTGEQDLKMLVLSSNMVWEGCLGNSILVAVYLWGGGVVDCLSLSKSPLSSLAGLIVVCTAAGVAALVVATICWCR